MKPQAIICDEFKNEFYNHIADYFKSKIKDSSLELKDMRLFSYRENPNEVYVQAGTQWSFVGPAILNVMARDLCTHLETMNIKTECDNLNQKPVSEPLNTVLDSKDKLVINAKSLRQVLADRTAVIKATQGNNDYWITLHAGHLFPDKTYIRADLSDKGPKEFLLYTRS